MSFNAFSFHPQIAAGITAAGYEKPTPIQAQTIPLVLDNRDLIGLAQTGTGKTAAFALPILQRLTSGPRKRARALILAPTRELAEQIHESVRQLGRRLGVKSVSVYGGVSQVPQIARIREGAEVIVACPGRLLDLLNQGVVKLPHLEVLVLDEADNMFDMGFLPDIRRILKYLPTARQTLLFSATMPQEIEALAKEILKTPEKIRVGHQAPAATVSHALYPVETHLKTPLLMKLLDTTDTSSVIVFTRTKHRAKKLAEQMTKAGFGASSLQGNLSQNQRQAAISGFRSGKFQILVATDIAARGIDVSQISHVINYDVPETVDAYTHRIGRTGRAERKGHAFTLAASGEKPLVRSIERVLGKPIEVRKIKDFNYAVPAPAGERDDSRPRRAFGGRPGAGNFRRGTAKAA